MIDSLVALEGGGVPCFTLRHNTERPVTIRAGTNTLLGLDPARIADIVPALARVDRDRPPIPPPPGWDGHAAERVAEALAAPLPAASCDPVPADAHSTVL